MKKQATRRRFSAPAVPFPFAARYHGVMKKKLPTKPDEVSDEPPDPWKEKLQETLKRERIAPRRWGFWLGIGLLAVMALLVWWLYPRPSPPLPPVVTFDVLIRPGEAAPLLALFEPPEEGQAPPRLKGRRFVFSEARVVPIGQAPARAEVLLEQDGIARAELNVPAELPWVAFKAQCPGKDQKDAPEDEAVIFTHKAQTDLLLVSVEGTLSLAGLREWQDKPFQDIAPVPDAAPALRAARKLGLEVVYLALESDQPAVYKKMRRWARIHFNPSKPQAALPEGPVLGRLEYPGDVNAAYAKLLLEVKNRYTGKRMAVTAGPALAQRFQAAGWTTVLIGDGAPLPGIERVRHWEDLTRVLGERK